ncbi:MAG: 4-hydroxy-3-methylbut-2-en-1-yl diphosphate synthase [Bacteroidetes bacterium GWF2_41_61]|nr:MAG: 4-hydroxy-3-methylbut-2-en-1-yl diphosphate synthase [Bacteroidetes bacterium GWE2_40_15]OFY27967.1 MAG: 4-hydroxy-3-methylbut-2-en-1-yl diphosphate synthase [Bacteroidetes bacterium GWF2_41_61]OFY90580.1 MAG: 4-hydroxy-3-methylbut-2-en-1-yl diphosphate synthase [Bacteroidetes bacterium RIFOXYA12_FULL_40_10]
MKKIIVKVGDVFVGGEVRAVVQSMCNTSTLDIEGSVRQCVELFEAGAEIIRLTTQGLKEVEALRVIKDQLRNRGVKTPLVADVHFSYEVAVAAASVADKVRINPGNFAKDHDVAKREFARLISVCKKSGCALRVGINHGSLGERIVYKYGDTPQGMMAAAVEWIEMAEENDFDQIIISLKSSNTLVMTKAYRLLYNQMSSRGTLYPLHLGVTEAGNGDEGRIKSAVALSALLKEGIGDTIRVSLTENPVNEIPVALFIANYCKKVNIKESKRSVIVKDYKAESYQEFILQASCDLGPLLLDNLVDDVKLNVKISSQPMHSDEILKFRDNLLQATRRKFSKPEYIACPGCGRTLFDLENVFEEVKRRTSHLVGYNIAVMGCIVNGPGEMADADYGYIGEGKNRVSIYRGKEAVYRSVPQEYAIDKLLELIEEDSRNKLFRPRLG